MGNILVMHFTPFSAQFLPLRADKIASGSCGNGGWSPDFLNSTTIQYSTLFVSSVSHW